MVGTMTSFVFTFIIAIGQMSNRSSVVKNTKLPPGPTDFCPGMNSSIATTFDSSVISAIQVDTDSFLFDTAINLTSTAVNLSANVTALSGDTAVGGLLTSTSPSSAIPFFKEPYVASCLLVLSSRYSDFKRALYILRYK